MHSIIPKEWEWLLVLVCINVAQYHFPSFYIFCGKTFQRDYIKQCVDNASMAMQPKAWMKGYLFKSWIGHFVKNVLDCGLGISSSYCHLLILNGQGSHVTVDVVKTARSIGLNFFTLPFHTFHAKQPLDISYLNHSNKPFDYCKTYGHYKTSLEALQKEVLAKWVSTALEKALPEKNIKSGFRSTGIVPLNPRAMEDKMGPSEFYSSLLNIVGYIFRNPIAMDLATPTIVHLATLWNLQHMLGSIILDYSDCEEKVALHLKRAVAFEGGSGFKEDWCDLQAEEDYLAELEATMAEFEP